MRGVNGSGSARGAGLGLADLTNVFHMPMVRAAAKIGVSMDTLRMISRRYGIQRWPYERIACLQRCLVHNAQGISSISIGTCDDNVPASIHQRSTRLFSIASRQLEEIYTYPNIAIDPEIRRSLVSRLKREQRFRNKGQKKGRRGHPKTQGTITRRSRSISRSRRRSNITPIGGDADAPIPDYKHEHDDVRKDFSTYFDIESVGIESVGIESVDIESVDFESVGIESVETLLETVLETIKVTGTDHRDWNACGSIEMMILLDDDEEA